MCALGVGDYSHVYVSGLATVNQLHHSMNTNCNLVVSLLGRGLLQIAFMIYKRIQKMLGSGEIRFASEKSKGAPPA